MRRSTVHRVGRGSRRIENILLKWLCPVGGVVASSFTALLIWEKWRMGSVFASFMNPSAFLTVVSASSLENSLD
jgi:hypothetical protein